MPPRAPCYWTVCIYLLLVLLWQVLKPFATKKTESIRLPIRVSEKEMKIEVYPILDVHSIVQYLWNDIGICVPTADVREYWQHARQHQQPWALAHPASDEHVPIGLYGDSAKITTAFDSDKILGVFCNFPLWRPKEIRYSRFLLFAIEESKLHGPHTMNAVFKRITWSCNLLFDGCLPLACPSSVPAQQSQWICKDRSRFAVCELRGDQLWHKQVFRWKASWVWTSDRVCHACDARQFGPGMQDRLYYKFAGWLPHEFSYEQFLARRMPDRLL